MICKRKYEYNNHICQHKLYKSTSFVFYISQPFITLFFLVIFVFVSSKIAKVVLTDIFNIYLRRKGSYIICNGAWKTELCTWQRFLVVIMSCCLCFDLRKFLSPTFDEGLSLPCPLAMSHPPYVLLLPPCHQYLDFQSHHQNIINNIYFFIFILINARSL